MTISRVHANLPLPMLDLKFIRDNKELVAQKTNRRSAKIDFEELLKLDLRHRKATQEVEKLRHTRNVTTDEIATLKRAKKSADSLLQDMKKLSDQVQSLEEEIRGFEENLRQKLLLVPNLVDDSVPPGQNERSNVEVKKWGSPPEFQFKPKSHWEIGEALDILDFERAAKMTGARFCIYKGLGARLERALVNFMLDLHTKEHGYEEILPPFLVNYDSMIMTGQLPKFDEDLFRLGNDDFFLIPTGEVPMTNLHRGEILSEESLPRSYVACTPCFRREAGSYGKETRGLIRQHQFNKVELVKLSRPDSSNEGLERLLLDAEEVLKRLELPYRVVVLCAGDTGFSAAKTYDIEVWLPGEESYKEISSCSDFKSFQARRGNLRFRYRGAKKTEYLHTLNGSGLAIGRTFLAILENHQQEDGSIVIPKALQPYMGGVERISKG